MRQTVTVLSTDGDAAVVAYDRPTACHQDCAHCAGGCGSTVAHERITVTAENRIGAKPGEQVVIEASTHAVFSAILLIYALPLALFFACYFIAEALGGPSALLGILGFVLGVFLAVLVSRRQTESGRKIHFQIVSHVK